MEHEPDRDRLPGDAAFRRDSHFGTEVEATYAGAQSFMRRKFTRDLTGVDIAITGIPFDQAVTNRPGTRFGPEAIRRASNQHAWGPYWPWFFDPFDTLAVVDYGDCFFDWGRKEDVPGRIEQHAADIIDAGVSMVSLGGDHFLSPPQGPCRETRPSLACSFRCPSRCRAGRRRPHRSWNHVQLCHSRWPDRSPSIGPAWHPHHLSGRTHLWSEHHLRRSRPRRRSR